MLYLLNNIYIFKLTAENKWRFCDHFANSFNKYVSERRNSSTSTDVFLSGIIESMLTHLESESICDSRIARFLFKTGLKVSKLALMSKQRC